MDKNNIYKLIKEDNVLYSDLVYAPEELLTYWFNLSIFLFTTATIFYNLAITKVFKKYNRLISLTAIIGSVISFFYMFLALRPYNDRMNYAYYLCETNPKCSEYQKKEILNLKYRFLPLVIVNTIFKLLVIFVISVTLFHKTNFLKKKL